MDKITKFLLKLSLKERNFILEILNKILKIDLDGLDIKKLKWEKNLFRIIKWKIRIIFKMIDWKWKIIDINYSDKTYK